MRRKRTNAKWFGIEAQKRLEIILKEQSNNNE